MNPIRRRVGVVLTALARRRVDIVLRAIDLDEKTLRPFLERQLVDAYDALVRWEARWL